MLALHYFKHFQNITIQNMTINLDALKSVFPAGRYRLLIIAFDKAAAQMGTVNAIFDMNSTLKENFE